MFAEFEKHTWFTEQGKPLNADKFNEIYEIFREYNDLFRHVFDEEVKYGSYHSTLTVHLCIQYSTGFTSSIQIATYSNKKERLKLVPSLKAEAQVLHLSY